MANPHFFPGWVVAHPARHVPAPMADADIKLIFLPCGFFFFFFLLLFFLA